MRSLNAAGTAAACFLLCACSEGLYSATAAGDGYVVVVNRMSGEARVIHGDSVVDLKPRPSADPSQLRNFTPGTVTNQPLLIRGSAKYRDGVMLVKISITPASAKM